MEIQTKKLASLEGFIQLYDMHTLLFKNVLDGISDTDAHNRMNTGANHIAWIAGSLVAQRYEWMKILGKEMKGTTGELFLDDKGIQEGAAYPPLAEFLKDWNAVSPALKDALGKLSPEDLDAPDPFKMPGDYKLSDSVMFSVHREAYMIGQMGLLRRQLGYEAMKYD